MPGAEEGAALGAPGVGCARKVADAVELGGMVLAGMPKETLYCCLRPNKR